MPKHFHLLVLLLLTPACQAGGQQHARTTTPLRDRIAAVQAKLLQAKPLPLSSVRLTGGPLKHAQEMNGRYLLSLEPDRMLAYYRIRAGLEKKAEPYGGWDGGGRNLTGHIAGHYLSAVSLMWASTGDPRYKQRADYIVKELKEVQDKNGDGNLVALEKGKEAFEALSKGEIRSGGFDLNGLWSPWYVLHKTYAGLRDAYRYTGNKTALDLEVKYAAWAERVLANLTEPQIQRMLNTEFGGMNEIFADLYADTGDRRWLNLSYKFEHRSFIEPLQRHQDNLANKHGNTAVPKLIGSAARFLYTATPADLVAATFFWDRVVQHHSYATGGHGLNEYFGDPDKLSDRVDGRTSESCNIYNMLKLTRRLFSLRPDAHYADFQERALFNHVLASMDPEDGRTCYMVPVGRGVRREYAQMDRSFTCCVGSGMESHALHGDGIYYVAPQQMWVTLYAPSTAEWTAAGAQVQTDTQFPEGDTATVKLTLKAPKQFTLSLRKPWWTGDGFAMKVNGEAVPPEIIDPVRAEAAAAAAARQGQPRREPQRPGSPALPPSSSFVNLTREWKSGDTVEITMPKSLRLEPAHDNPRVAAIMWGPLALAGDLGPEGERPAPGARPRLPQVNVPVLLAAERPVMQWVKPLEAPGQFTTEGVGRLITDAGQDVKLAPFYRLHRRTYAVYWDLFTDKEWEQKKAEYAAEQERQKKLEAATVAFAQPGEMQPERDFHYQAGEGANIVRLRGRAGRSANTWFSFDLPVEAGPPLALVVTYFSNEDRRPARTFDVLVDGQRIARETVENRSPSRFYDVEYAVPAALVQGKQKVTVRFQAVEGSSVATVFGLRMIRK